MKPQTISEKILSAHAGKAVYANDLAVVSVDGVMASDTTAPYSIKAFEQMGGQKVWNNDKVFFVIDHASPAPNERIGNLHSMMRAFAKEQGLKLYDVGEGICHQLMVENHHVKPSQVFVGADSHSCLYGAVNAFGTGVGSTDLAAVMLTGKIWLKVPQTIKVVFNGKLQAGVSAKDLVLFLARNLTIDGATYQSIEYHGEAIQSLSLASRMTVANMGIEMGAKAAIFSPQGLELSYDWTPTYADNGAEYARILEFDASEITPQIALPHSPDNVRNITEALGTPISYAFIGTCVNGRLEDLHAAAEIMKGKRIATGVRMLIAPASQKVFIDAMADGTAATLIQAGATFITSGCGPCVGSHLGVPGDGEVVISSANRNFKGRMGNPNAFVYLGSPATVAASAIAGKITQAK